MSVWWNLRDSGKHVKRSPRFLAREVKAGRLRAARIGGRGEYMLRPEWLDEWMESQTAPILVIRERRRA
jgi:hypothetical protein